MKIFISYTVRDGYVTTDELRKIENMLGKRYDLYIDLLHNPCINSQENVIRELLSSDRVFLINTPKVNESPWVELEIKTAKNRGIPIFRYSLEQMKDKKILTSCN